jgi:eukaryotic-like serine/threonine-protein kinase
MNLDDRVLAILERWAASREQGQSLSAEQLCQDCPDLVEEVRGRIKMLEAMRWLEASDVAHDSPQPRILAGNIRPSTHHLANEPTVGVSPSPDSRPPAIGSYVRYVGDYELISEIARGGMGVVFKARQVRLKRIVALKMILAGRLATAEEVRRFHTEAESAANLEHPNIVPIFEVGEQQGLHYFSMGFVDGVSLSTRLAEGPLSPREAARILQPVAEAVHYAHQKGVIHRDLKPGNILLDKNGQPRVTDFGLAKRVAGDASEMTGTGQILGTASYMPPEQALGQPGMVREGADVYAMGAVLYALLTGRPPFQADNPVETLRQVMERDPVAPRQLNPAIPSDLETICLKCLEKAVTNRYRSAKEVADELERFLDGRPIQARPIRILNRAWRWCKRNRTVAGLLAAVFLSLVVGTSVASYFALESNQRARTNLKLANDEALARGKETVAKQKAEAQTRIAFNESANLSLNEALSLCEKGEANIGLLWMVRAHDMAIRAENEPLADACRAMASAWLATVPRLQSVYPVSDGSYFKSAKFGQDERTLLVAAYTDGLERGIATTPKQLDAAKKQGLGIHDIQTGKLLYHLPDVSPAGRHLAINPAGTRVLLSDSEGRIRQWSIPDRHWVGEEIKPSGTLVEAAFSRDNHRFLTTTFSGQIEFWNVQDGKPTGIRIDRKRPDGDFSRTTFCFGNSQGATLYTSGSGGTIQVWDPNSGEQLQRDFSMYHRVAAMTSMSLGGRFAVYTTTQSRRIVVHWMNDSISQSGEAPTPDVLELAYSADGRWLACTGLNNKVLLRDGTTAALVGAPAQLPDSGVSLQFSSSGDQLLVGSSSVELWNLPAMMHKRYEPSGVSEGEVVFLANPTTLVRVGPNHHTLQRLLPTDPTDSYPALPSRVLFTDVDPQHQHLIGITEEGVAFSAELANRRVQVSSRKQTGRILKHSVSPTGRIFATISDSQVCLWDVETAQLIGEPMNMKAAWRLAQFSQDGSLLGVFNTTDRSLHVVSTHDGTLAYPPLQVNDARSALLHPDGKRAVVGTSKDVEVWSLDPPRQVAKLGSHDLAITGLGFSPDGQLVISWGPELTLRVWNLETGELVGRPIRGIGKFPTVMVSPDGKWVVTRESGESAHLWHLRTGRNLGNPSTLAFNEWLWSGLAQPSASLAQPSFSDDSQSFRANGYSASYPFLEVPQNHEKFKLLIETWTGLSLDDIDVRTLPRDEWKKRKDRLTALGWRK